MTNDQKTKYPNLFQYRNRVDIGPYTPPFKGNMELVRLEEIAYELELQQEEAKAKQQEQQANEAAKAELRKRIAQLQAEAAMFAQDMPQVAPKPLRGLLKKRPGRKQTNAYVIGFQRIYEQGEDRAAVIDELLNQWIINERSHGTEPDASTIEAERKRIASGIDYQRDKHRQ